MRILFLIAAASLAACSSQPQTTEALPSPAAVAGNTAAPATAGVAAQNAVARNERSAFEPPPGFKLRTVDGQEVYCRKMVVLGSRFPKQLCMTQEQLEEHERSNQAMRDDMSQHIPQCTSAAGCVAH